MADRVTTESQRLQAFATVQARVETLMADLRIPGVALGILDGGWVRTAGFGVTNVEQPRPVDATTLFRIASITKTFTATAVMRLVEMGKLDLDAPLTRYIPNLRMSDSSVVTAVTLRHCLTHYGGWEGDHFIDTGRGDDALARYVDSMVDVPQKTPLGTVWSYNNAGFSMAGRAIENVTGHTYERVIAELLTDRLGMCRTGFFWDELITESAAVGHAVMPDGPQVARPQPFPRGMNPLGGLISCVDDLLRWARFHLGDGLAPDCTSLLSGDTLRYMQSPLKLAGSMATDIGITFQGYDAGGARVVGHGGSWASQLTNFRIAPEHGFAVVILTNAHNGPELHGPVTATALEAFLGAKSTPPITRSISADQLERFAGTYTAVIDDLTLSVRDGRLMLEQPRRLALFNAQPHPPPIAPVHLAFVSDDEVVGLDAPFAGARGEFLVGDNQEIEWLRWGGRIHRKVSSDA